MTKLPQQQLTEPKDMLSLSSLSILLMNESTIKNLFTKCLPNAQDSEFQVHYRAIVYHCYLGQAQVLVTVPTVFYNFPQEVSSGSVDYHLNDMTEAAQQVKPLSLAMVGQMHQISAYLESKFDKIEVTEVADNSFHRHPSAFGFSSIDYDKDPTEPGVIYRKAQARTVPQTDSVIYYGSEGGRIHTTETRIVNVTPHQDGGVEGTYLELPTLTYTKHDDSYPTPLHRELDGDKTTPIYTATKSDEYKENYKFINTLIEWMPEVPLPNIDFVDPNHITQYTRKYTLGDATPKQSNYAYDAEMAEMYGYDLDDKDDAMAWRYDSQQYNIGAYSEQ